MEQENNGDVSAFATSYGLTKREYFAGIAMQGLCAGVFGEMAGYDNGQNLAQTAVLIADELLKQLEK